MQSADPIIIAGGGIGGLATAHALRLRGFDVRVFERVRSVGQEGAGLALQPNGMSALRRLGLDGVVARSGVTIEHVAILDQDGRILTEMRLRNARSGVRSPMLAIARGELRGALMEGLDGECVHAGRSVTAFEETGGEVTVQLSGGEECRGMALIGCDGLNSTVRRRLLNDGEPRYSGYTSWRGICPRADLVETGSLRETWGRGWRLGYVPVNDEELYWFAVANRPAGEVDRDDNPRPTLLNAFAGWRVPATRIVEATPIERILRTDIHDRAPVRRWGRGVVTLVGDAAHPMTPDLGQGASQAIEDAVVVADCLAKASSTGQGLRDYEHARFARTARLTRLSRRFGHMAQLENALGCRVRNMLVRMTPARITAKQTQALWRFQP
jgi:2-polyprenyl-6-methoxyphenol hydroxylase-like FAD-dependent oxidoreductase